MAKCKICGGEVEKPKPRIFGTQFDEELNRNLENEIPVCKACLNKPFVVTTVCREDMLNEEFSPEEIAKFDDAMMQDLADKIGESTTGEAGTFWLVLEEYGQKLLEDL